MWVFTETGFISAVIDRTAPDTILVRARDRSSLDDFCVSFDKAIITTPDNDYPFRVKLTRDEYASWLQVQGHNLMYSNFKDRVADTRGDDFAQVLGHVWSIMHAVEDDDARDPVEVTA